MNRLWLVPRNEGLAGDEHVERDYVRERLERIARNAFPFRVDERVGKRALAESARARLRGGDVYVHARRLLSASLSGVHRRERLASRVVPVRRRGEEDVRRDGEKERDAEKRRGRRGPKQTRRVCFYVFASPSRLSRLVASSQLR